jgi:putative ABC transport system permease protein
MWKVTIKGILAHKIRFLLTGVAVILGVSFIAGTLVLTATINKTFDGLFTNIYANTDAAVRQKAQFDVAFGAGRGRLEDSVTPVVRKTSGVSEAAGIIQGLAQLINKKNEALNKGQGAPALGFAWIKERDLSSFHLTNVKGEKESRAPVAPNEIVIDKHTADKTKYKVGDTIPVLTKNGRANYHLVGVAKFGDADSLLGATAVIFMHETAAKVLGQPGKVDEILVKADSGVSQDQVVRNLKKSLVGQKNIEVLTGAQITKENQNDIKDALGFFNTFLLVFGVVALLVGSFIIFNTFSIIVAQRSREMALLRAIGAKSGQVVRSVLFEAALVGVVASVIGFVAGVLLAVLLKGLLAALGVDIPASGITIPTNALVWSFIVGMGVTIIAAVFPAIRASRIPPIAALQQIGADQSAGSWKRLVAGLLVTGLGMVFLLSGLFGGGGNALQFVGFGAFVIFIGIAVLGPTIARPISAVLGWPIRRMKGITGLLAEENAKRNPKRTSATAAALMIGVALVALITVFGASANASVGQAIDKSMKADYIITTEGFGNGTLPRTLEPQLRKTPGVTLVSGVQSGFVKVKGSVTNALGVDPKVVDSLFDLEVSQGNLQALQLDGLAVSKNTADDENLKVGQKVPVQFAQTGRKIFTVQAIYDQTAVPNYVISTAAYEQNFPDVFDAQIYLKTEGGPTPRNRAPIEKTMKAYPGGKVQDQAQFKAAQSKQIDQLLNLVKALLLFAIFIALFGIANTLGLSIIERTRELGLMRAVGMTRRQVRSLVRWEAVIIALLGAFLGIVIGVAFGWVLVKALSSQGIKVFQAAPSQLIVIFVLAAIFGVVAAIWPARKASKLDVLQAISTE